MSNRQYLDRVREWWGRGRSIAESAADRARRELERRRSAAGGPGTATDSARRHLPSESVVVVEYSPQRDGDPDPGEVVWAWVPFEEDPDQGKDRPVVVIGRRGPRLVGVPLTTRHNRREAQVSVGTGAWDPKRRRSYARIWRLVDVEPDAVRREGAALDRERFDAVVAAVDEYYDVRRP